MRGGALDAVPDGSLLVFEQPRAWLDARLVHLFSGKLVRVTTNGVKGIEDVELGPYAGVFSVSIPVVPSQPWFRRDVPPDVTISPTEVK
jgi:hypothetical protein